MPTKTITPKAGQFIVDTIEDKKVARFQQKQHITTTFRTTMILPLDAVIKCYYDHSTFGTTHYFYGVIDNNPGVWIEAYDISHPGIYPDMPIDEWFDVDINLNGIVRPTTQESFSIQKEFGPGLSTIAQSYYQIISTPTPRTGTPKFLPEDYGELKVIGTISSELTGTTTLASTSFYNDTQRGMMIDGGGSFELSSDQSKTVATGMQMIYYSNTNRWVFDTYKSTNFACIGKSVIVER